MPIAYVRTLNPIGEFQLVEIVQMSSGSPPARPQPEPPLGIWGPTDPRPSHPIAPGGLPPGIWGPTDPRPSHPISGIPGLPGYEPPAGGGEGPGVGHQAIVLPIPPSDPPSPPPAGIPPGSTQVLIWFGPGTKPAQAWVAPYVSQGPVPPGTGTTPPPVAPGGPPPQVTHPIAPGGTQPPPGTAPQPGQVRF